MPTQTLDRVPGGSTSPDLRRMVSPQSGEMKKQYKLSARAVGGMRAPDSTYDDESGEVADREQELGGDMSSEDGHNGETGGQGPYLQNLDKGLMKKILRTLRPPM